MVQVGECRARGGPVRPPQGGGVECGPNDVEEVVQVERADDRKEPLHHGPLQVFSSVRLGGMGHRSAWQIRGQCAQIPKWGVVWCTNKVTRSVSGKRLRRILV